MARGPNSPSNGYPRVIELIWEAPRAFVVVDGKVRWRGDAEWARQIARRSLRPELKRDFDEWRN